MNKVIWHLPKKIVLNFCQVDLIVVTHEGRKAGQKNVANDSKRPHVCNVDDDDDGDDTDYDDGDYGSDDGVDDGDEREDKNM